MRTIVDVQYACEGIAMPSKTALNQWVNAALTAHHFVPISNKASPELTIRIVNETEGRELNQRWRQQQNATNVLTFPFESPPGVTFPLLGDIIICAPVVLREAQEQQKAAEAHWAHLVIHGVLHLLGHDHQQEVQAQVMEELEINILAQLGYPNPFLETS